MVADSMETRIGRIEGEIKHLATKADVEKVEKSIAWKMAGLFILQTGVLAAIVKLL